MNQPTPPPDIPIAKGKAFVINLALKLFIPLLILAGAWAFFQYQIATRPQAKRKKPPQQARLVTVIEAQSQNMRAVLDNNIMGPVIPAQRVTLMPEVSGLVLALDPVVIPGGFVQAGQTLLNIDPRDYQSIYDQRRSERARAYLNLKLELGNQKIAQQEYELLAQEISAEERELVLRQPHLASTEAALRAADAAVKKAQVDLERCRVAAPFNAVIERKHVDRGARVGPTSSLVTLAGTDRYWIDVKVRVDQLKWIRIPRGNERDGSVARIYDRATWGEDVYREGRVIRLLAGLETQGRLARLLVEVADPLALNEQAGQAPMLLNSLVKVAIEGSELSGGFPLNYELLRDGDQVWIMTADKTLEIRPVTVSFRGREQVYVTSGLQAGDKIVVTDIAAPVVNMPLRLQGDKPKGPKPGKPQEKKS